jgi:SAF domain
MARAIDRPPAGRSAARGQLVRLEPPTTRRRARVPEIALGVALVAIFGLATVLWQTSTSKREPMLVLARPVARGEVLTADVLRSENVRLTGGVSSVSSGDARLVIGKLAVADLPAGTLVSRDLFVDQVMPGADERVVGMALAAGEYPTARLRRGDTVDVLLTPTAVPTPGSPSDPGAVLVAAARVWDIDKRNDNSATLVVSVVVPADKLAAVATAAAQKQVRLALARAVS